MRFVIFLALLLVGKSTGRASRKYYTYTKVSESKNGQPPVTWVSENGQPMHKIDSPFPVVTVINSTGGKYPAYGQKDAQEYHKKINSQMEEILQRMMGIGIGLNPTFSHLSQHKPQIIQIPVSSGINSNGSLYKPQVTTGAAQKPQIPSNIQAQSNHSTGKGSYKTCADSFPKDGKKSYEQAILDCHNYYRRLHGVPQLVLDPKLSEVSTKYATKLSLGRSLVHSPEAQRGDYGENLYWSSDPNEIDAYKAVDSWYSEEENYSYDTTNSKNGKMIGHFTAVVWKTTAKLGVGVGHGLGGTFVVCNYTPPGNTRVAGNEKLLYNQNVPQRISNHA